MDNKSLSHVRWKCQYHIVFMTRPQPHRPLKHKDNYPILSFARFFSFFYSFRMAVDVSAIAAIPVRIFNQKLLCCL